MIRHYIGFPVLICGTTDARRRFHPFSVSISSSQSHEEFCFIFIRSLHMKLRFFF
jgi:hypothetical protein